MRRAFSLIEVLVSLAIIAVLVGLLLPTLIYARDAARTAVCAGNLRQVGMAWTQYLDTHNVYPQHEVDPDWRYGGVRFIGPGGAPVLAADRPINHFLTDERDFDNAAFTALYRCPSDKGVYARGTPPSQPKTSLLEDGKNCYEYFGTSYRANPYLLDAFLAGVDRVRHRPLKRHEVHVAESRLLVLGDAAWYYATRPAGKEAAYDASWHATQDAGNMLAVDGSIRFMRFEPGEVDRYTLLPRPGLTPK